MREIINFAMIFSGNIKNKFSPIVVTEKFREMNFSFTSALVVELALDIVIERGFMMAHSAD